MTMRRSARLYPHIPVRSICLLVVLLAMQVSHAWSAVQYESKVETKYDIEAYTEEKPPFNFSQHGEVTGISVDLFNIACQRAHLTCRIRLVPWARALALGRAQPNSVVFSTVRRADREHDFIWIGPTMSRETWIFGAPNCDVAELKNWRGAKIGVVRDDAAVKELLSAGVPQSALDYAPTSEDNYRKLAAKRVDCIADMETSMIWGYSHYGLGTPPKRYGRVSVGSAFYFAMNIRSDEVRAKALQAAIDAMRAEGSFEAITAKYLK